MKPKRLSPDEIRSRIPVSQIVRQVVPMKRRSNEWIGLCPFHNEKTPSFTVTDEKGFFHCFGCGAHGDVIEFMKRHWRIEYGDAMDNLSAVAAGAGQAPRGRLPAAQKPDRAQRSPQDDKRRAQAEARRAERAAAHVERVIKACSFEAHPYLEKKGFPGTPALVHPKGWLVVPIRNRHQFVTSAQYIDSDGKKRFHPGGKISGNYHRIGRDREVWICEGYATGASIHAALRSRSLLIEVRVCFSADNLKKVAREAKQYHPKVYVVADHDWWRCSSKHEWDQPFMKNPICPKCGLNGTPPAGEKAAIETGLPYLLPPNPGQDANDVHLEHGIDKLASALFQFRYEADCKAEIGS